MTVLPALVGPLGPLELGIILLILIVIFGPKRLPGIGRSLGEGMREFKDSVTGDNKDDDKELTASEKAEPVRAEKNSEATPAGGQSS